MGLFSRLFKKPKLWPSMTRVASCYKRDCEQWGAESDKPPCYGCVYNPKEYYKGGADNYRRRAGGERISVLTDTGELVETTEDELRARKPL